VAKTAKIVIVFALVSLNVVGQSAVGVHAVRVGVSFPVLGVGLVFVWAQGSVANLHAVVLAIVVTAKGVGVALIRFEAWKTLVSNGSPIAVVFVIVATVATDFALGVAPTTILALLSAKVAFTFPKEVFGVVTFAARTTTIVFVFVDLYDVVLNKGFQEGHFDASSLCNPTVRGEMLATRTRKLAVFTKVAHIPPVSSFKKIDEVCIDFKVHVELILRIDGPAV